MPQENPTILLTSVTFGDRPSVTVAVISWRHAARMAGEKFPHVAKLIEENIYMDDTIKSVHTFLEAFTLISDTETALTEGNFYIKHWIGSG